MKPLIVALDVETEKEALSVIRRTQRLVDIYKVGPGLVIRHGPSILKRISKTGKKIFLDMKFHDIPATMARSINEAGQGGVFSATVHTSAGRNALLSIAALKKRPEIWGVTVLTSLSDSDLFEIGFVRRTRDQVKHLAGLAKRCGLDGVVASVEETKELRSILGPKFRIITPGIRLPENAVNDQKRIATPSVARAAGSDFIVVGRPVVESKDPLLTAQAIMKDWNRFR